LSKRGKREREGKKEERKGPMRKGERVKMIERESLRTIERGKEKGEREKYTV
jgi:hypothetical protein